MYDVNTAYIRVRTYIDVPHLELLANKGVEIEMPSRLEILMISSRGARSRITSINYVTRPQALVSPYSIYVRYTSVPYKPVDPKFPGTGLSDIKKSFEKIAMTFLARTKIKGIYHQSYLCLYLFLWNIIQTMDTAHIFDRL